jgi:mercuric ion transport protein
LERLLLRSGCFAPVLVALLDIVGLSAAFGWLDYVLLPALGFFIALTVYAVWRRQQRQNITGMNTS